MEKENMKKVLMILLGAMLVLSMVGVAGADAITDKTEVIASGGTATTVVTLGLHEIFTVTLPSAIGLTYDETHNTFAGKSQFSVDILRLDAGHNLTISVDSANDFKLVNTTSEIPYKLGYGSSSQHIDASTNPAILITEDNAFISTKVDVGMETGGEIYFHAKVSIDDTGNVQSNLDYSDQLTFTIQTI